MSHVRRPVPHPEWVLMYRRGLTAAAIARLVDAPGSTVAHHISLASKSEPELRSDHESARNAASPRQAGRGLQTIDDIGAFVAAEDRFPSLKADGAQERTLARWLSRRRREAAEGSLTPTYREALDALPGWDIPPRIAADEAMWWRRLAELSDYLARGNDWPRHKKTDSEEERVLGVWLHIQRYKLRRGELDPPKAARLNNTLPGWRAGRRPAG